MDTVTINIVSRWDSKKVLFSANVDVVISEGLRLRAALEIAVKAGANLDGANLAGANLAGAYLDGANLDDRSTLTGERPIFMLGPIGSESRTFVAYITRQGLRLRAGCFFGPRETFLERLDKTHGNSAHAQEYNAALAMIDAHYALWELSDVQESAE